MSNRCDLEEGWQPPVGELGLLHGVIILEDHWVQVSVVTADRLDGHPRRAAECPQERNVHILRSVFVPTDTDAGYQASFRHVEKALDACVAQFTEKKILFLSRLKTDAELATEKKAVGDSEKPPSKWGMTTRVDKTEFDKWKELKFIVVLPLSATFLVKAKGEIESDGDRIVNRHRETGMELARKVCEEGIPPYCTVVDVADWAFTADGPRKFRDPRGQHFAHLSLDATLVAAQAEYLTLVQRMLDRHGISPDVMMSAHSSLKGFLTESEAKNAKVALVHVDRYFVCCALFDTGGLVDCEWLDTGTETLMAAAAGRFPDIRDDRYLDHWRRVSPTPSRSKLPDLTQAMDVLKDETARFSRETCDWLAATLDTFEREKRVRIQWVRVTGEEIQVRNDLATAAQSRIAKYLWRTVDEPDETLDMTGEPHNALRVRTVVKEAYARLAKGDILTSAYPPSPVDSVNEKVAAEWFRGWDWLRHRLRPEMAALAVRFAERVHSGVFPAWRHLQDAIMASTQRFSRNRVRPSPSAPPTGP